MLIQSYFSKQFCQEFQIFAPIPFSQTIPVTFSEPPTMDQLVFCAISRAVVRIFTVVSSNTTFRPMSPPPFL